MGNKQMPVAFDGIWWSVELPEGWIGQPDRQCASFRASPPLGALQISSTRKDVGLVDDKDLREFAEGRIPRGIKTKRATYGPFEGFSAEYSKEGFVWKEWWLRCGQLMVYATYNVVREQEGLEMGEVEKILSSLTPIS